MRPSKAIVCDLFVEKIYTCLHLPAIYYRDAVAALIR